MDAAIEIYLDETEWWDRAVMALALAEKRTGAGRALRRLGRRAVTWIGPPLPPGAAADGGRPPEADVYFFSELRDVEILRRLSQMPDESETELLVRPFVYLCPEAKSLACVNFPDAPLEDLLEKLLDKQ